MDDRIKKKLDEYKHKTLSDQERLERKLKRTKEQEQLFKFLADQAIDPAFQEYLKICHESQIICCIEHFQQHGYSAFCLDKKTIPRPGEGEFWAPSYLVRLHYAELDETTGEPLANDFDYFDVVSINIAKKYFRGKKFRRKPLVGFFDKAKDTDIVYLRSFNFSELTKELVSETLKIFVEAYLDMRLHR